MSGKDMAKDLGIAEDELLRLKINMLELVDKTIQKMKTDNVIPNKPERAAKFALARALMAMAAKEWVECDLLVCDYAHDFMASYVCAENQRLRDDMINDMSMSVARALAGDPSTPRA